MKKVLVTGETGLLAQKLALRLHSFFRNLRIGDRLQQLSLKKLEE
ncbi:hypothetical protein [Planktothrix agardhii]|nr:hypothetical protein [Planktothrix agardhii]MDS1345187.1 hypothetical protein [Planktothrix agardhii NRERC-751]